jgi:hypothetical protein
VHAGSENITNAKSNAAADKNSQTFYTSRPSLRNVKTDSNTTIKELAE